MRREEFIARAEAECSRRRAAGLSGDIVYFRGLATLDEHGRNLLVIVFEMRDGGSFSIAVSDIAELCGRNERVAPEVLAMLH